MWISPDGLGSVLNIDLNDEPSVRAVSPYTFGYRVFHRGKDGKYYSPYKYNSVGMEMGERVPAWYTRLLGGNVSSAIPSDIESSIKSYNDLEGHGYHSASRAADIPSSADRMDETVADAIRRNYEERLSPSQVEALKMGHDSACDAGLGHDYDGALDILLEGLLPNGEKRGLVIDANRGQADKALRSNWAPHLGYSLWGIADPRFSVMPITEFLLDSSFGQNGKIAHGSNGMSEGNMNIVDRALIADLVAAGMLDPSYSHGRDIRLDVKHDIVGSALEGLSDILPGDAIRDLKDKIAYNDMSYVPLNGAGGGMFSAESALPRVYDKYKWPVPVDRFDPDKMNETWDRYMRGSLLHYMHGILSRGLDKHDNDGSGLRVVKVMVPLESLVPNSRLGDVSAQTDSKNEMRALEMTLGDDIAGSHEFAEHAKKYYGLLDANPDMRAADAWHDAFGDKYGDLHYLTSDEGLKDVVDGMRREVDDYIKRKSICHGLKRGPGDD